VPSADPASGVGGLKISAVPCSRITGPGSRTTRSALVLTVNPASGSVPIVSPAPKAHAPASGDHLFGSSTVNASGTCLYQPYQSPFRTVGSSPAGQPLLVTTGDMFIEKRPCRP